MLLAKEGVSAEVIDLRTLAPLDKEAILTSVKKTGKVADRLRGQLHRRAGRRDRGHHRGECFRAPRRADHPPRRAGHPRHAVQPPDAGLLPAERREDRRRRAHAGGVLGAGAMPTKVIMPQLGESVVEGTVGPLADPGGPAGQGVRAAAGRDDRQGRHGDPRAGHRRPAENLRRRRPDGRGGHASGGNWDAEGEVGEGQTEPREQPIAAAAGFRRHRGVAACPGGTRPLAQTHGRRTRPRSGRGARYGAGRPGDAGGCGGIPGRNRWRGRGRRRPRRRKVPGFISPAVGRLAAEMGVDLSQVIGTGAGGRITKKDVLAYVATPVAARRAICRGPRSPRLAAVGTTRARATCSSRPRRWGGRTRRARYPCRHRGRPRRPVRPPRRVLRRRARCRRGGR